jgi:hypothetical protein
VKRAAVLSHNILDLGVGQFEKFALPPVITPAAFCCVFSMQARFQRYAVACHNVRDKCKTMNSAL